MGCHACLMGLHTDDLPHWEFPVEKFTKGD
jgi:hypothetical protein